MHIHVFEYIGAVRPAVQGLWGLYVFTSVKNNKEQIPSQQETNAGLVLGQCRRRVICNMVVRNNVCQYMRFDIYTMVAANIVAADKYFNFNQSKSFMFEVLVEVHTIFFQKTIFHFTSCSFNCAMLISLLSMYTWHSYGTVK